MDEWRNIAEAAKQIGVSEKTLRRYCSKRLINFSFTAGGHYRFRQSSIDLFLSQHRPVKPDDKRKRSKKQKVKLPAFLKPGYKPEVFALPTIPKSPLAVDIETEPLLKPFRRKR